jgi:tetratricopeptide (TPR) repeat protein
VSESQGRDGISVERRAFNARWLLSFWLLTAQAGCSWIGVRSGFERTTSDPTQVARNQAVSEHAQEAIDRGDWEQARIELLQLANEDPRSAEAKQRLGLVLQLEGRLAEAEACYRAALERDPDYVEALIGLGQVEAQRGETVPAIKHFESAIELDPQRSRGHFSLGRMLESQGRTDEALAEYFRVLELDPNNTEISLNIAAIQLMRNQPDQALSRLDRIVEPAPQNGEARNLRGRAHFALKHFGPAVDDFREAALRLPNRVDIHYNLAVALDADHKPAEALRAAEQALRLAPNFSDARTLSQRLALAVTSSGRPRPRPRDNHEEALPESLK